jgi:hypothetical protein
MFSKGIDALGYVAAEPQFRIVFKSRGCGDVVVENSQGLRWTHFEIDSSSLGWLEMSGRFNMSALVNGKEVLNKWAEINPYTGGAVGTTCGDNLNHMVENQKSTIVPGQYAVSFGFFDAGGYSGYSDRAYMHLTRDFSNWMGELAIDSVTPLSAFTLPGSHDSGMFTVPDGDEQAKTIVAAICNYWNGLTDAQKMAAIGAAGFIALPVFVAAYTAFLGTLSTMVLGVGIVAGMPKRALINLANTQKDTITTQLQLGTRFFDFRPGYNLDGKDKILRHQHNFVPGYAFELFLKDVTEFLADHPNEIVVVQLSTDGFMKATMNPDQSLVKDFIDKALVQVNSQKKSGKNLISGDSSCFNTPYRTLIAENQRLIVFQKDSNKVRSSYTDSDYQTQDPMKVLHRLSETLGEAEKEWTCLQLQGTYNGTGKGVISGSFNFSDASSAIMWTKADFDRVTYPWALEQIPQHRGEKLFVLLNDFTDNALTDICVRLTNKKIIGHKNLLKNGDAQQGLTNWHIMANGGNGWLVEDGPAFSCPEQKSATCFTSSCSWDIKAQTIDLLAEGYSADELDMSPLIQISEWYAGRSDCESFYHLIVELRDAEQKVLARFDSGVLDAPLAPDFVYPWKQISYAFSNYGKGVRYIYYEHSGKDKKFWNGNYGSKMTGGKVIISR